jgi:hypothetical protein
LKALVLLGFKVLGVENRDYFLRSGLGIDVHRAEHKGGTVLTPLSTVPRRLGSCGGLGMCEKADLTEEKQPLAHER